MDNNEKKIHILLVDDHPVVREGVAAMINRRPDMAVVGEASTGREAVTLFEQLLPDVTLMDLRLPELNGVEAIATIRANHPQAKMIILTTYDGDEDIYRGLQAGAMAYLLKDTPRPELLDTIRAVYAGQKRIPPEVAAKLTERMFAQELTGRERDVLDWVSKGLSNKEIGERLAITEGTVKTHINSLLAKLGVQDRTQAVTEALRRGILHL